MSFGTRIATAVGALLLAACTSCGLASRSEPIPGPVSAPSSSAQTELKCKGADCDADDKEVLTTPCHEPSVDVTLRLPTVSVAVAGAVVVRKSTVHSSDPVLNARCDSLYWAKLADTNANTQSYVLTLKATDVQGRGRSTEQRSDNPSLEALTKTVKARAGDELEACVSGKSGTTPVCVKVPVV